jgi:aryl-alcohol dehydrogenase-like predicted oxidoreductase
MQQLSSEQHRFTPRHRSYIRGAMCSARVSFARRTAMTSHATGIPYRELGSTGVKVSAIGIGGWHLGLPKLDDKLAIRILHRAIDEGIHFLDNSWDYNDGISEVRMGRALRENNSRGKVFLMTKIDGRSRKEAARQLEQSLERLQTDCIDLVQHHEILRFEDPDRIFAAAGAQEALLEAKQAGKLRYIGFTGHKDPRIHLYMLEVAGRHGYKFDTAQMPLNVMDAHFRSFAKLVVPELVKQGVGVLAMKTLANGAIVKSQTVTPIEAIQYALNLPTSVAICGIDSMEILEQALQAARTFRPFTQEQLDALLAKTAKAAASGEFEPFKISSVYDSTAKTPAWLGEEPEHLQALVQP